MTLVAAGNICVSGGDVRLADNIVGGLFFVVFLLLRLLVRPAAGLFLDIESTECGGGRVGSNALSVVRPGGRGLRDCAPTTAARTSRGCCWAGGRPYLSRPRVVSSSPSSALRKSSDGSPIRIALLHAEQIQGLVSRTRQALWLERFGYRATTGRAVAMALWSPGVHRPMVYLR